MQYKSQIPQCQFKVRKLSTRIVFTSDEGGKSHKLHGTHLSLVATKNVSKEAVGLIFKLGAQIIDDICQQFIFEDILVKSL